MARRPEQVAAADMPGNSVTLASSDSPDPTAPAQHLPCQSRSPHCYKSQARMQQAGPSLLALPPLQLQQLPLLPVHGLCILPVLRRHDPQEQIPPSCYW